MVQELNTEDVSCTSPNAFKTNGQLVTPALSPICEHGLSTEKSFFEYEADDEAVTGAALALEPSSERDQVKEVGQPNNVKPDTARRTSSVSKLSSQQIQELVSSPESLPVRTISSVEDRRTSDAKDGFGCAVSDNEAAPILSNHKFNVQSVDISAVHENGQGPGLGIMSTTTESSRPNKGSRSASSPLLNQKRSTSRSRPRIEKTSSHVSGAHTARTESFKEDGNHTLRAEHVHSPIPASLPLPPLSLPTYLQLELSSERPSALYLYRSASNDIPYESSKAKFERLHNFLLLPGFLEQVLWFGAIVCLDAWLYTFTILPLRFLKAVAILTQWWGRNVFKEIFDLSAFVYDGVGRIRQRHRRPSSAMLRAPITPNDTLSRRPSDSAFDLNQPSSSTRSVPSNKGRRLYRAFRHRRTRSTPSILQPNHKADILQGLLIVISCYTLMWFDASRMYHNIRGQSAIKLYVIYNVLEVFDRLFSALGQDILECLFSKETLERDEHGRSKIMRPLGMFALALVYNLAHSTALFYQVVTLNVAVNSYSNALLTLLMSNQFVEIKGTVFKKFEKDNLFQLTCADIVERFQLWLMLLIIALRNVVEVGGLSISLASAFGNGATTADALNVTSTAVPLMGGLMIPKAFTLLPKWTGEVLGPFLIVLGSEMLVDWCKHAYISKFNNVKPNVYGRFFDVLAKDYYSHAFADQNLTKRLGLPVIPLSCLFIRACVQTYHMILATHLSPVDPPVTRSLSLDAEEASTSPATMAAIQHIDYVFRRALGRSSFGTGLNRVSFSWWSIDDLIALGTMVTFFVALFLLLLALKLVLGMGLLSIARNRYKGMTERQQAKMTTDGRRFGGWGAVEMEENKRSWIYKDDPDSLQQLKEKEDKTRNKIQTADRLDTVDRYSMVAKRIW